MQNDIIHAGNIAAAQASVENRMVRYINFVVLILSGYTYFK